MTQFEIIKLNKLANDIKILAKDKNASQHYKKILFELLLVFKKGM